MEQVGARSTFFVLLLAAVAGLAFAAGLAFSRDAAAADKPVDKPVREKRVIYKQKTELDFEGMAIEGEIKNPGEFYFQHRPQEKFDSLVKRRANFHREMLRDVVMSK